MKKKVIPDISTYLLMLLAFSLPLNRFFSSVVMILLFIHWLFSSDLKNQWHAFTGIRGNLMLPLLYLWYVIGITYSKNTDAALFDMQLKLPLLILPLIISAYGHKIKTGSVVGALTGGLLMSFLIFLIVGICRNYQMHHTFTYLNPWFFTYNLFANPLKMQPNYIAMYLCLAAAFCIREFFIQSKMKNRLIYASILLLLVVFLILLSSRTQWICLILILMSAFPLIKMKKREWIFALLVFTAGLISGWYIIMRNDVNSQHFRETFMRGKHGNPAFSGRENRKMIWSSAFELIKESPFMGKGNGDVTDELIRVYRSRGFTEGISNQLNAHNEFLQTAISSGIPSMLYLLFICGTLIYLALRKRDFLLLAFGLIILTGMMTESLLNRQNGVVFVALFLPLLYQSTGQASR